MSYDTAKPFTPENVFSGGYVDNTPENSLADAYSPFLRNCRLDGTAIISRPGYSLLATLTSGDYPRGISRYIRPAATDKLIVRHNQSGTEKLVTIEEDGTVAAITTAALITSDNRMSFLNVNDVVYCMNGVDDFGKLDGTTYTTPATGIANFAPSFGVDFNSSHFVSGWSDNGSIVYKSVGNNYEDFASAGSDNFTFNETVTGLTSNNQALFYFTNNTISVTGVSDIQDIGGSISYATRPLTVKEGAVNHHGIVNAGARTFFVTPSNKIAEISRGTGRDGFEVSELSERKYAGITNLMNSLDQDQTECFGYFLPKENLIAWHFKSRGSSFNDTVIVYDTIKDAFLPDNNKFFYGGIDFNGRNYTISNIEPKVYIDETGNDDEDSAINFRYETKYFDLGLPTRKKELWESRTYTAINELAKLTQFIVIDGNTIDEKTIDSDNIPITTGGIGTGGVGTFGVGTGGGFTGEDPLVNVDILRTKGNLQVKGKRIKFIFIDNEIASKVRLESLNALVELLPSEASNLTV